MNDKLAEYQNKELVVTSEQMDLVTRTIAKGATKEELQLFLYDCSRHNVHPLDKLLYFTKRTDRKTNQSIYTPITSIDLLRSRAEDTGNYAGNDDPTIQYDNAGNIISATSTVWKIVGNERYPFTATARWSSYYPGDSVGFMWKKMPELMLGKCAEALALRKAFPRQLAGLFTSEEMAQAFVNEKGESTQIHETKTEPKQIPAQRPYTPEQLKKGNAVWCKCWDNDPFDTFKRWVVAYDRDSLHSYDSDDDSYKNAEPIETTFRYLPVLEMLEKILDAGYEPDNGAFRRGDRQIPYEILELCGKEDNAPIHLLVCEEIEI